MQYFPAGSVSEDDPGGEAELAVWERLKDAFDADERGVLYHQYPIFDKGGHRFDRKPDFVCLHEELGLLIVECKGYTIDQIDYIAGDTWHLRGISQDKSAPLEQARDQGFHLQQFFRQERTLRDGQQVKIPMNVLVALPNISRSEWERRDLDAGPAAPRVILSDDLTPVALRDRLSSVKTFDPLSEEEFDAARKVLSCGQPISGAHGEPTAEPTTKAEHYEQVEKGLRGLDEQQQDIGMRIAPGPQQIRGIAGSGKTVLVAMKAARIAADPDLDDWDVAVTFNTKSLYDHITELISRFYQQFTGEEFVEEDSNVEIIHGWGGATTGDGVYRRVAQETPGADPLSFNQAKEKFGYDPDLLDVVAEDVLETGNIPTLWDAILIDEAQDFEANFLNMCLAALDENNRLIWAYDEAQDLGTLTAPRPKRIFGTDDDGELIVDMSGSYENGVQKSHIMRESYRAPREVLMAAHTIGMGLKREEGAVQTITRADGWENIGYEVEGDFRKVGSEAKLSRPDEHSPHPLQNVRKAGPFVRCDWFNSKNGEIEWVAEQIAQDIHEEGLDPEQIMAIPLGPNAKGHGHYILREELEKRDIDINCVWNENNKTFAKPGEVTVSRINRAKGNEAASVYVIGAEQIKNESYLGEEVRRRNQAFVAITRSRAWCTISGIETEPLVSEFEQVLGDIRKTDPVVTFDIPDSRELDNELEQETEDLEVTTLSEF
ncbi:nuclease-related domain-containing DEAD/DEAH box helicase [Halomicrobium salinisoli]|uniref:nuclease-related domain-containing DEAD/DEAH box helicase n=1 Tax=Halomicrobium salinisoli TaxID=2878391 RepID=UPI001CF05E27|nr:nuclease-related domain-containing DEAD/DEAH box helicase [Halomicrobium salinisoli]